LTFSHFREKVQKEKQNSWKEVCMDIAKIDLSIVVAMTPEHVIGIGGDLPWHLPSDLARFRKITLDVGVVVMGYNTYFSIITRNGGPLCGRKHIVLSRKHSSPAHESVQFVVSFEEALVSVAEGAGHACVIGGEEIFKLFLPLTQVKKMYVTTVHAPTIIHGDVCFPSVIMNWKSISNSGIRRWDPRDEYETSWGVCER